MKPIAFMARCQNIDIRKQYEMGVRCFDLRIRYNEDGLVLAHGIIEYDYSIGEFFQDIHWLNDNGNCYVRILYEVRNASVYNGPGLSRFKSFCMRMEDYCEKIHWWCGRNLYNWEKDYDFGDDPKCDEKYGSVSGKKWLYGWWPWLYARLHNRKNLKEGSEGILLIDYVNI